MIKLCGVGISGGVCTGKAKVIYPKQKSVIKKSISPEAINGEWDRFVSTVDNLIADTNKIVDDLNIDENDKAIFSAHIMIVQDPELHNKIKKCLNDELISLESAIYEHFSYMAKYFRDLDDEMFQQRATDYEDVGQRMLSHLSGDVNLDVKSIEPDAIPILSSITPSQVIAFFNAGVKCFCTQHGSITSHSAILAKSMGICYIAKLQDLLKTVKDGDLLLVDGKTGGFYIEPDSQTLTDYRRIVEADSIRQSELANLINKEARTLDDVVISLSVNMELPEELDYIKEINADSIGLFRTEFLYLESDKLPSEEDQYKIYSKVLRELQGNQVTIRTMDLGGDKFAGFQQEAEENPYLGCRGVRFSLQNPGLFKTQIKALLRAGVHGTLRVMFPMINDLSDYKRAMKIVNDCKLELSNGNIPYAESIEFGAMIEVPSAALTADELGSQCDFFSIGTNDLTQYTVAVDRNNEDIAHLFVSHHPAVLKLMLLTLENGQSNDISVSICGEMASELKYIPLLLKLGFRELSVNPRMLSEVKELIRSLNLSELYNISSSNLTQNSIETFLKSME